MRYQHSMNARITLARAAISQRRYHVSEFRNITIGLSYVWRRTQRNTRLTLLLDIVMTPFTSFDSCTTKRNSSILTKNGRRNDGSNWLLTFSYCSHFRRKKWEGKTGTCGYNRYQSINGGQRKWELLVADLHSLDNSRMYDKLIMKWHFSYHLISALDPRQHGGPRL